jgi:ribosome-binding factor A
MAHKSASDIKKERRKSLFFREMTQLIRELADKESSLATIFVSQVDISPNSGVCYIYFSAYQEPGEDIFNQALETLKLYKPSLRSNFARRVQTRYAPELVFLYDKAKEKERRINDLLNKVQSELIQEEKK